MPSLSLANVRDTSRITIAAQLLAVFVVGALAVCVLVGYNTVANFKQARARAVTEVAQAARSQARDISGQYTTYLPSELSSLLSDPGIRSLAPNACGGALGQLARLAPGVRAGLVVGGRLACASGGIQLPASEWFAAAVTTSTYRFGLATVTSDGTPLLGFATPFRSADGRTALLLVEYPATGWLQSSADSTKTTLYEVDQQTGTILDTSPRSSFIGANLRHTGGAGLLAGAASQTADGPDGVKRIFARAPIAGTSFVVLAGVARSAAYAEAVSDLHRNVLIGFGTLVVILVLGVVLYRRMVRPLRRLRDAIDVLASTEVQHDGQRQVPETGPRELAALGSAFNAMVDARGRSEARLASLVRHGSDLVFIVGDDGRITYATPSVQTLLGPSAEEMSGRAFVDLVHADEREPLRARLNEWLRDDRAGTRRIDFRLAWGETARDVEARVQNLLGDPAVGGVVITCHDITDRKRAESQLAHAAMHDSLTGLPNRALVLDRLTHLLSRSGRSGATSAVLFIDLDRFKLVNDSNGHSAGDVLLVQVAERFSTLTRPGDTLGRFGGDEFVVICEGLSGEDDAQAVARRLLDGFQLPFQVCGQEVFATASIGIAIAAPGDEAGDLLRDADAAMYRAKERGRAACAVFDDGMREGVRQRLDVSNKLRHAIAGGGLFLDYQPEIDLSSGRAIGVEALLRWRDDGSVMRPDEFIPVAEETGLIVPIGEWVLRESCRQLVAWQAVEGFPSGAHISVNVSARQVSQPDFADTVIAALEASGLDPQLLTLEVTESVLMHDKDAAAVTLSSLRRLGVGFSIDDFGTGYSSLGYLERLPIDELKIDRSFVSRLDSKGRTAPIIESIVDLAHAVGLSVVAEGVERTEQAEMLRQIGCDAAQGYHFARPLTPSAALRYLLGQRVVVPTQSA